MNTLRLLVISLTFVFLTACGGGGGGGSASTTDPSITSFVSSSSTITVGQSVNLTAVFTNGTASINNNVGAVTSNTAKSVSPTNTTSYILTVTNAASTSVTATVTVTVITDSTVQISWNSNPETAVNRAGGGYKVYYSSNFGFAISDSGVIEIDVPYASGAAAPTTTQIQLFPSTYYIRILAYSALDAPGTSGGSVSTATTQTTLLVP